MNSASVFLLDNILNFMVSTILQKKLAYIGLESYIKGGIILAAD